MSNHKVLNEAKTQKTTAHKHQTETVIIFPPLYEKREPGTCVDRWKDLNEQDQKQTA